MRIRCVERSRSIFPACLAHLLPQDQSFHPDCPGQDLFRQGVERHKLANPNQDRADAVALCESVEREIRGVFNSGVDVVLFTASLFDWWSTISGATGLPVVGTQGARPHRRMALTNPGSRAVQDPADNLPFSIGLITQAGDEGTLLRAMEVP